MWCIRGVILSSNDVKDMLINHGRPLIYSSSLPIYNLYFIKRNIEKLINADDRRTKLNSLIKYFNQKLKHSMLIIIVQTRRLSLLSLMT